MKTERGDLSARAGNPTSKELDQVRLNGVNDRLGCRNGEIVGGALETLRDPPNAIKRNETNKSRAKQKKGINTTAILTRSKDKAKKSQVLRGKKVTRTTGNFDPTSCLGGAKKGGLEGSQGLKRAAGGGDRPGLPEGLLESGGVSKPTGNGRLARCLNPFTHKGKTNRKVVRETTAHPLRGEGVVRGMVGDINDRGEQGVGAGRNRGKKTVEPRGPRKSRGRIIGQMKKSMSVVVNF